MAAQDYSYIGKGRFFLNGVEVGNVSEFSFAVEEDKKELPDYTIGGGGLRNSLRRIKTVGISLTMTDYSKENLSLALFGTTSAVTAGTVTDEVITAPANVSIDGFVRTANLINTASAVVLTDSAGTTTYVNGTDYELTAAGVIITAAGAITASQSLKIDYTKLASDVIQALTTSAQEYKLDFVGLNEAQSGDPVYIRVHKAKFGATSGLSMISDDFGNIQLAGDSLKDTTITTSGLSQYIEIKQAA